MIRTAAALAALCLLSACSEPPKHRIVFVFNDTCRIVIDDLQYGQANSTERPCTREPASGQAQTVTVNFLSETCNAYRYSFKRTREGSDGVFMFEPEQNVPNANCTFIPQYSNPDTEWVLNPK